MQRAWNKYGAEAFEFEVLEIGTVDLDQRELFYINQLNSSLPKFGYNISKETNNARLGHQQSKKSRKKISKKLKGIKRSIETKKKISISKSGSNNPAYGKKQTKELIEKRVKNNRKQVVRNDGKTYYSLQEAAKDIGAQYQGISQSLRKGHRVKGYRFTYGKT